MDLGPTQKNGRLQEIRKPAAEGHQKLCVYY